MGDKFPQHIYHSIVRIGALIAHEAMVQPMYRRPWRLETDPAKAVS
jgi:hypothetical protein